MPKRSFRILYIGVNRTVRRTLIRLLELAGYAVHLEVTSIRSVERGQEPCAFVVRDDVRSPRVRAGSRSKGGKSARRSRAILLTAQIQTGTEHRAKKVQRPRGDLVMSLRSLRESVGTTQSEMAAKTLMTQSQLSRVETRRDHLLSTLRTYVEALGGDIRVIAVVGGAQVSLEKI